MKPLAAAAVGLGLVILVACGSGNGDEIPGRYENSKLGFAFDYPDDWEQIKVPVGMVEEIGSVELLASVAMGPVGQRLVGAPDALLVEAKALGETVGGKNIDEYLLELDDAAAQVAGQLGGALEERGWTELGGLRARRYLMDLLVSGEPVTNEVVVTVREDYLLQLTCQGQQGRFDQIRTGCQVVYDSFEFTSEQ